ncbi:carboxymuconolactone decarboxylase family protein [Gemmatimonadota bacterium]
MTDLPKPPQTYEEFTGRFPKLAEAWEMIGEASKDGPLDQKTTRLVKLGVAIGALREGPVHSSVRKALALGITQEELEHVVTLAVGTIGFPSAVAAFTWIHDEL